MFNERFSHLANTIKDLGKSCEQLEIQYTTKLSTLEVTVSQQTIQIKKLQDTQGWELVDSQAIEIKNLQMDIKKLQEQLGGAQEIVSKDVDTILRLQAESDSYLDQCGILQEKNNSLHEMVNAFKGITPYATNMRVIRKADGTIPIDIHSGVVEQEDNPFPGSFVPVRTIPTDEYSVYLASGRGMQQYPFNPDDSTLLDWPWGEPEAYPYTHPIREIPDYSKVKVRKS